MSESLVSGSDYLRFRGKCREMSEELVTKDPSLTLVRGYYYDPHWGEQEHWWCVDSNGGVVDPTKDQFPSKGNGLYVPFDGMCSCEQCGKDVAEENAVMAGPYPCCSNQCAMRLVGL